MKSYLRYRGNQCVRKVDCRFHVIGSSINYVLTVAEYVNCPFHETFHESDVTYTYNIIICSRFAGNSVLEDSYRCTRAEYFRYYCGYNSRHYYVGLTCPGMDTPAYTNISDEAEVSTLDKNALNPNTNM